MSCDMVPQNSPKVATNSYFQTESSHGAVGSFDSLIMNILQM